MVKQQMGQNPLATPDNFYLLIFPLSFFPFFLAFSRIHTDMKKISPQMHQVSQAEISLARTHTHAHSLFTHTVGSLAVTLQGKVCLIAFGYEFQHFGLL